jgi:DNA-binding NarL/FixJ family response regulator
MSVLILKDKDLHQTDGPLTNDWEATRVVLLSGCSKPSVIQTALLGGAVGVIAKDDGPPRIVEVIIDAARGSRAPRNGPADDGLRGPVLSTREIRTLALASRGLAAKQIAQELSVSVTTVSTFKLRAREELGAVTMAQAVAEAIRLGYID